METKAPKTRTITLTGRPPVKIRENDWPIVASADDHDGQVECQANTEWFIKVRRHEASGRVLVYGGKVAGNGGQYASFRAVRAGYLLSPETGEEHAEAMRAVCERIRDVAEAIDRPDLADECVADLPAEEI